MATPTCADARLLTMITQGWVDEMIALVRGQITLDKAVTQVKRETRRFIRAQDTWFRKIEPLP